MRIVIVRHGDPNYELDTLTETGWKEARLVAERIAKMDVKDFYVSPLGRAQDTASVRASKRLQSCFPIRLIGGNLLMFVRLSATAVLIILQTENGAKKFRPVRFF